MTTKSINPLSRLTELEAARDAARQAENDARDEYIHRQRAVPEAREALTGAVAAGEGVDAATKRFEAAQKAASDPAWGARAEGLAARTRSADAAVRAHTDANLAVLVEDLRPRAEAAVALIKERAADLRDALGEYNQIGAEISRRSAHVQWFRAWEQIPPAPLVDELTTSLDACRLDDERLLPVGMPRSTESPAAEAERLAREHESAQQAGRVVCRGCAKQIHPGAGSGHGFCLRCSAVTPAAA